ncbi:MAG TPA: cytochrome b [Bosea sp. (in: a-proteobacteria)]
MILPASRPQCWHPALVGLHWLTAVLIALQYGLARLMGDETRDLLGRFALYQWHKSVGLTVALFVVLRLALRLILPAPAPVRVTPLLQYAALIVHAGLYLCLVALPVTGLLMVSSAPIQIPTLYFGWFVVPHPIGPDKATYEWMRALHERAFDGLFVLGLIHIGAALLHQFVWRDGLMRRM